MELKLRPHPRDRAIVSRASFAPARLALLAVALMNLVLCAPPVSAGGGAIHIGFGDCAGAGSQTAAITNSCTSNNGGIVIYGSFSPSMPTPQFLGIEAGVDIFTSGITLSPWWHMESGGCRQSRIAASWNFTGGPYTCTDFWSGQGFGGMDYGPNEANLGSNTARIRLIAAVAEQFMGPISTGTEYYAFAISILKSQSTGPASCDGCLDRACFAFTYIEISQPAPTPDQEVTQGSQNVITYNGGVGGSVCAGANIQKGSWGHIKSIYR
jgi:hypothetical protein